MKRFLTVLLLVTWLAQLGWAQINPFQYRLVKDTEFTLAEYAASDNAPEGPRQVFSVKRGTVVTVLNRSAASPWIRVQLGDGSIGWVSPEAFCDKTKISSEGKNWLLNSGRCQNCFAKKDIVSSSYIGLCQTILDEYLPKAFLALPFYGVNYGTLYRFTDGIGVLMGLNRESIASLIGEPDAVAGTGFIAEGGLTCSYYARVACDSDETGDINTGIYVFFNKDGLVANEYTYHDFSIKGRYADKKVIYVPTPDNAVEGTYQLGKFKDRSYHDRAPKTGTFTAPTVTDAELEAAQKAPIVYAREGLKYKAGIKAAGEVISDVHESISGFLDDILPDKDTFKVAFYRTLIFLLVLFGGGWLITAKLNSWGPWIRLLPYLILCALTFPYPIHFFHTGSWSLWGWVELIIGCYFVFVFLPNIIEEVMDEGWAKCPKCRKWIKPYYLNSYRQNPKNEKPRVDSFERRALMSVGDPVEKDDLDLEGHGKHVRKVEKVYHAKSKMVIHFERVSECQCRKCMRKWSFTRIEMETVPGPIIRMTETETDKTFQRVEQTVNERTGKVLDEKKNPVESEHDVHLDATHIDYTNYEPYYKRYCAGDEDALGEYYAKFWKSNIV